MFHNACALLLMTHLSCHLDAGVDCILSSTVCEHSETWNVITIGLQTNCETCFLQVVSTAKVSGMIVLTALSLAGSGTARRHCLLRSSCSCRHLPRLELDVSVLGWSLSTSEMAEAIMKVPLQIFVKALADHPAGTFEVAIFPATRHTLQCVLGQRGVCCQVICQRGAGICAVPSHGSEHSSRCLAVPWDACDTAQIDFPGTVRRMHESGCVRSL